MRKYLDIALGIVTSVSGFLDAGAIATAAQAGAQFGYSLIWAFLLGTVCVTVLVEMSGRLAAVSKHPLPAAIRERLGFNYFATFMAAGLVIDLLILASEIGGASIALQLVTGVSLRWWAVPVTLAVWLVLWNGKFSWIEDGISVLGLSTVAFVVVAATCRPDWGQVARGVLPSHPAHGGIHYWFLVVSIIGALISPYLFDFYSCGAVEEKWDEGYLRPNRWIAGLGMGFGSVVALGLLIASAVVLKPAGIGADRYDEVATVLTKPWGPWARYLFAGCLFVACVGAAMEVSLDSAYVVAQAFGWNWGENAKPYCAARFSAVYTLFLIPAAGLILAGVEPLGLTLFSMAVTTVILPLVVFPFLVLMNDARYVKEHRNGVAANVAVFAIVGLAFLLAVVAIPLEIFGGG